jgi:hypothetical protein
MNDVVDELEQEQEEVDRLIELQASVDELDVSSTVLIEESHALLVSNEIFSAHMKEIDDHIITLKSQMRPTITSFKEWLDSELHYKSKGDPDFELSAEEQHLMERLEEGMSESDLDSEDLEPLEQLSVEELLFNFHCECGCKSLFSDQQPVLELMQEFRYLKQRKRREAVQAMMLSCTRLHNDQLSDDNIRKRRSYANSAGKDVEAKYNHSFYRIFQKTVCKGFFMLVTTAGLKMLKNIMNDFDKCTFLACPEKRGGSTVDLPTFGKRSKLAIKFLRSFADREGLPNPDGRGGTMEEPPMLLPATYSKLSVYQLYSDAAKQSDALGHHEPVNYSTFTALWKLKAKFIKIMTKRTDFCDTCTDLRSRNLREQLDAHLQRVIYQRKFVKDQLVIALQSYSGRGEHRISFTSFDYCERVRLPVFLDQPKDYYFMSGLGVDIFGVVDDLRLRQENFLLTEGLWHGEKGINGVGSMLFHRFTTNAEDKMAELAMLLCDNCFHQNKCCYSVMFFLWWVIVAQRFGSANIVVEQNFPIKGHSKFSPDRGFGGIKKALKKQGIFSSAELYHMVNMMSGRNNTAICGSSVVFYDWKKFLVQYFKDTRYSHIPIISRVHHIRFDKATPGKVQFKEYPDDPWQTKQMLLPGIVLDNILRPGMVGNEAFKPLEFFVLPRKPIAGVRLEAVEGVRRTYEGFLGQGLRFYGPCTY